LGEGAIEDVVDEGGFAGAGDAGDYGEQTEGERDVDVFEIVGARAKDLDGFAVGAAARFGDRNLSGAAEIAASERFGAGGDFGGLAVRDEVTAGIACAGARSTTKSARRMVSSSCSTTRTVFPRCEVAQGEPRRRSLSRACRPMDGSSRT